MISHRFTSFSPPSKQSSEATLKPNSYFLKKMTASIVLHMLSQPVNPPCLGFLS